MIRKAMAAVAAAMVLGSASADPPAQPWKVAGMKGGAMGWNAGNLQRIDGAIRAERFLYYAKTATMPDPSNDKFELTYTYMVQHIAFRCAARQFQMGDSVILTSALKELGRLGAETRWRDLQPNTPENLLAEALCNGASVTGLREAADGKAALDIARAAALPE